MPFLSIIGALFSGLFKKVLAIAANIPPKVWYAIGAVIAALLLWHVHTGFEKVAAKASWNQGFNAVWSRYDAEVKKNRINLASIAELERDLAAKNHESDLRAKALADSIAASNADQARFAALRKADASKDETLKGIRDGALAKPTCKVPPALTDHLGGL